MHIKKWQVKHWSTYASPPPPPLPPAARPSMFLCLSWFPSSSWSFSSPLFISPGKWEEQGSPHLKWAGCPSYRILTFSQLAQAFSLPTRVSRLCLALGHGECPSTPNTHNGRQELPPFSHLTAECAGHRDPILMGLLLLQALPSSQPPLPIYPPGPLAELVLSHCTVFLFVFVLLLF